MEVIGIGSQQLAGFVQRSFLLWPARLKLNFHTPVIPAVAPEGEMFLSCLLHSALRPAMGGRENGINSPARVAPHSLAAFQSPHNETPEPGHVLDTVPVPDARRRRLIASLQQRFRLAEKRRDSRAKQELFREAIYLGIQPQLFTVGR